MEQQPPVSADVQASAPAAQAAPAPSGPPPLTEEQRAELLAKKRAFAATQGDAENACHNAKCRCAECTCGSACTCNVSPDVTCDPCAEFKAKVAAKKANADRLKLAEDFFSENIAPTRVGLPGIRAAEILELQWSSAESVCLVDVRPEEERNVSTLQGALTLAAFEADIGGASEGKVVIPFCTIGGRSSAVVQRLLEMEKKPWKEVRNFTLSIIDWCHSGGALVDSAGEPTKKVFVPAEKWASMFPVEFEVLYPGKQSAPVPAPATQSAPAPAGPPPLTEEQLAEMMAKKKAFAASQGDAENACQNAKCRCVECTCGAACTCNISPDVTCDPCAEFKAKVVAKAQNAERLRLAEEFFNTKVAPNLGDVPGIRAAEILDLQRASPDSVLLIDVRPEEERVVSTCLGAVTLAAFEADVDSLSAGKVVVPFCTVGGRSAPLARRLLEREEKPWKEVRNFELSIIDWCHSGGQLVDPAGQPTNKVFVPGPGTVGMFPLHIEVLTK